jgi:hypothetical protein
VRVCSCVLVLLCSCVVGSCAGNSPLPTHNDPSALNQSSNQNEASTESESQASARAKATSDLISGDIIRPLPQTNSGPFSSLDFSIGLPQLSQTRAVGSKHYCEGAAGSVIPPLAITECGGGLVLLPITTLRNVTDAIAGPADSRNDRHVSLIGLERYWVPQKQDNLCWAAALETSRAFLHLHHLAQESIPEFVANECKSLASQPDGADAYQISYVILKMMNTYDGGAVRPRFCTSTRCMVDAISHQRPVIILNSSHAVLVQGIDYETDGTTIVIRNYRILDPAGDGQVESKPALIYCRADAIITF